MAEIKPFKAFFYNRDKIDNLSKVICLPYDIISKDAQKEYYKISLYNMIRLVLGKDNKDDNSKDNRYTRARGYLQDWIRRKVLIQDKTDCFYFHKQVFSLNGKRIFRLGFIGLLRLKASVLGHEKTKVAPKKDRLRLLKSVKANLSPIFVLFSDQKKIIKRIFKDHIRRKSPFMKFIDHDKNTHFLWRIEDTDIKNRLREDIRNKQIFIADGHHRYEVGLKYCLERQKRFKKHKKDAPWNYILTYFTDIDSESLVIMPVHRLIKDIDKNQLERIPNIFNEYFKISSIKDKNKFLSYFHKPNKKERHCFGLSTYGSDKFYILRLKNKGIVKKIFPQHKKEFHNLDIFILEELVIKKLLSIKDKTKIDYHQDAQKAMESIEEKKDDILFLVNPTKIEDVKRIALVKERMPVKSTYFYPKVLAGLLIHRFNSNQ